MKKAISANVYKTWSFEIYKKEKVADPSHDHTQDENVYQYGVPVCIPYVTPPMTAPKMKGCTSMVYLCVYPMWRRYQSASSTSVGSYNKPFNTLISQVVRPKDKTPLKRQCGLVYKVECGECHKQYNG